MHEMKFSLIGTETISLTGQEIDKLIRAGDGDAALLYLYIRKTNGKRTDTDAAKDLDKSKGWVASASAVLSKIGLVQIDASSGVETDGRAVADEDLSGGGNSVGTASPPLEPRQYTSNEIADEIANDSDFSSIVDEAQRKLGKILSPDDLLRLFGLYENLRMPPEVIFHLITHCITEALRSGGGRTPSMRYIEKAAFTWEREGVLTLEKAEDYIKNLEKRREVRGEIKKVLQIRDRELSATEGKYVDGWIDIGMEPEAIAIAYDKTVVKTGAMTWPYIDKILKNWHNKGLLTEKQVLEAEGKQKANASRTNPATGYNRYNKSDNTRHDELSREEMERMERLLSKVKKAEGT